MGGSDDANLSTDDEARRFVAERGLIGAAVAAITPLIDKVDFAQLGQVKRLLKQFFSDQQWGPTEEVALADAVGSGHGSVDQLLAAGVRLWAGWRDGRFGLRVQVDPDDRLRPAPGGDLDLAATFGSGVVPEATPNPRTLRFATAHRPMPASRSYRRGREVPDPGVARLFAVSNEIADVLVGADFVAVTIDRPARWPGLLAAVLVAVAAGFGGMDDEIVEPAVPRGGPARSATSTAAGRIDPATTSGRSASHLEQAWADLGHLRPDRPEDLAQVLSAARDNEPTRRQVAANLLREAPPEAAEQTWAGLAADPSRLVRRTTIDAIVDVNRENLRPLLEQGLADQDPWVRWKALHGLANLGPAASRSAIEELRADPDFRVRLEAAAALQRS